MIKYITGDILESDCEALVNTVNCVGVMGRGLAYKFKNKYKDTYKDYVKWCNNGDLVIGKLHYYKEKGKLIINFPTKDNWRYNSKLEYIDLGLQELSKLIVTLGIKSIAIPPLGCGNGGLVWEDVKCLIECYLSDLDCCIVVYEPSVNMGKDFIQFNIKHLVLILIGIKLGNKFNTKNLEDTLRLLNTNLGYNIIDITDLCNLYKDIKGLKVYYNIDDLNVLYKIGYDICISNKTENTLCVVNKELDNTIKKSIDFSVI